MTDSGFVTGLANLTFGTGANAFSLLAGPVSGFNAANGATFTGTVTLSGNTTFTTVNNGTGLETLTLGALADGAVAKTILKEGGGNLTLNTAASSLVAGTALTVDRGSVTSALAGALGTTAAVTVKNNALFTVGAAQQIASLSDGGVARRPGHDQHRHPDGRRQQQHDVLGLAEQCHRPDQGRHRHPDLERAEHGRGRALDQQRHGAGE